MTQLREWMIMMVGTLKVYRGKSSKWLQQNVDWLKTKSLYGIDVILYLGEKEGWVRCKDDKDGKTLIYFPTQKGIKEYNKYHS